MIKFEIKDDGSIPIVHINGKQVSIVSLTYCWRTKTEDVSSGDNFCVVKCFLPGEHVPRRFMFDILGKYVEEEKEI